MAGGILVLLLLKDILEKSIGFGKKCCVFIWFFVRFKEMNHRKECPYAGRYE